jgi:hypothetical protein
VTETRRAWVAGLLNGILVLGCVLVAHPFAETGFLDDWSYVKTAKIFAHTGRFVYNGWATAMLGWLIPWGAAFAKMFGDSYFAVRLSTLPLVVGCMILFQICAERFGIRRQNAMVGGLSIGLSPVFLPLAASFHTDIGGLFAILLCLYLCQRAVLAVSDTHAVCWLCLAAGTNVIGGTARQIVWLGALVMVPATAWLLRRRRGALLAASISWVLSIAAIFWMRHWFNYQPYTVPEHARFPINRYTLLMLSEQILRSWLCLFFLLLPVVIAWLPRAVALRRSKLVFFLILLGIAIAGFAYQAHLHHARSWLMPWLPYLVYYQGMFEHNLGVTGDILGTAPLTLGRASRAAISLVVLLADIALAVQFDWKRLGASLVCPFRRDATPERTSDQLGWVSIAWTIVPFLGGYFLLLTPRATKGLQFDRYLVCILPFLLMLLLREYQDSVSLRLPKLTLAVLFLFGAYGIAGLHDWFAMLRGSEEAVKRLRNAGIPRSEIEASWESDSEYQIETQGHMNMPEVYVRADSFVYLPVPPLPIECRNPFFFALPALNPHYIVTLSELRCFVDSGFPPVRYRAWLPPFSRKLYILKDPALDRVNSPVRPNASNRTTPIVPGPASKPHPSNPKHIVTAASPSASLGKNRPRPRESHPRVRKWS